MDNPSSDSSWSGSWIEKWLNQGVGSESETTSKPTEVVEQEDIRQAPDSLPYRELSQRLDEFISSFNKISIRSDYLIGLGDRLQLSTASPEKQRAILIIMGEIAHLQGPQRPKSGKEAGNRGVLQMIKEWEEALV
jgi:hypothetical protein